MKGLHIYLININVMVGIDAFNGINSHCKMMVHYAVLDEQVPLNCRRMSSTRHIPI